MAEKLHEIANLGGNATSSRITRKLQLGYGTKNERTIDAEVSIEISQGLHRHDKMKIFRVM
jgi:hypothetical protein